MLEAEWVLRSAYGYRPADVCRALPAFAGFTFDRNFIKAAKAAEIVHVREG